MGLATSTRCDVLKILVTLHLMQGGKRVGYNANIRREVFLILVAFNVCLN